MLPLNSYRENVTELLKAKIEYLGLKLERINEATDMIGSAIAPFINVSAHRLSSGNYVNRKKSLGMILIIFQTTPNANELLNIDALFDLSEKIENVLLSSNSVFIDTIIHEFDYQLTRNEKNIPYGVISISLDYKPNPPSM